MLSGIQILSILEPKINVDAQKKKIRAEKVELVRKLCNQV